MFQLKIKNKPAGFKVTLTVKVKKKNLQISSPRSGSAQHHSPGQSIDTQGSHLDHPGSHLVSEHEGQ